MPDPELTREQLIAHIRDLNDEIKALRQRLDEADWVEDSLKRRTRQLNERMKELDCAFGALTLARRRGPKEERLQQIVALLPEAMYHPRSACAQAVLDGRAYSTPGFATAGPSIAVPVQAHGRSAGRLEVRYRDRHPDVDEGPFLREERALLQVVAECLGLVLETP